MREFIEYLKVVKNYSDNTINNYEIDIDEYKVGDILRATEGSMAPLDCIANNDFCTRKEDCKTHKFWAELDDVINKYIDSKTLQDLIK